MTLEANCSKWGCVLYKGIKNEGDELTERPYCFIYPNGIPYSVVFGKNEGRRCYYLKQQSQIQSINKKD
jgi:hypothetical protein